MKARTKITWCDFTLNAWEGCTKVSDGCRNCYAEARDQRWAAGIHWGHGAVRKRSVSAHKDLATLNRRFGPMGDLMLLESIATNERWIPGKEPAPQECLMAGLGDELDQTTCRRVKPQVFSLSLGDILDPEVPIEWLAEWLAAIGQSTNLEFLLLTKRPELWKVRTQAAADYSDSATDFTPAMLLGLASLVNGNAPHVAWGTTVENQATASMIHHLAAIPAARRFVSFEPLLGPVAPDASEAFNHHSIHLAITGGESGDRARPMHAMWLRQIEDACHQAGVPHHFKQWGEWAPAEMVPLDDNQRNPGNRQWVGMTGRQATDVNDLIESSTVMTIGSEFKLSELPAIAMHRTRSKIAILSALQPRLLFPT